MSMHRWDQLVVGSFVLAAALLLAVPVAWMCGAGASIVASLIVALSLANVASSVITDLSRKAQKRGRA